MHPRRSAVLRRARTVAAPQPATDPRWAVALVILLAAATMLVLR